jgi:aspartyl-tRNA(Asn)/glutamyl-tRNA(Gln) amidotransferase subunit C
MNASEKVSVEDVRRVAELANVELTSDEQTRMLRDLNAILTYVDQLNQLDTSSVEPMAQVADVLASSDMAADLARLRADETAPSLQREEVMRSAPDSDRTFFRVPKVIER